VDSEHFYITGASGSSSRVGMELSNNVISRSGARLLRRQILISKLWGIPCLLPVPSLLCVIDLHCCRCSHAGEFVNHKIILTQNDLDISLSKIEQLPLIIVIIVIIHHYVIKSHE
jgi:hypothetical protein